MGFRTTGVRLVANVSQFVREMRTGHNAITNLNKEFDQTRLKGARMANDLAGASKKSRAELTEMLHAVEDVDDQIVKTQRTIQRLAQQIARTGGSDELFKNFAEEQKRLRQQINVRNLLPDPRVLNQAGATMANEMSKGFGRQWEIRLGAAAAPALLAVTPMLGAAVAGAVVGAAGAGGVVGGLVLAARDSRVQGASAELGQMVVNDLMGRSQAFVPTALRGIERIRQGYISLGPDLNRVFSASRFVDPLVDGAIQGGRDFMRGFADAIENADAPIEAIRQMLAQLGLATGELFSDMAQHADAGARALSEVTMAMSNLIDTTSGLISGAAYVYEFTQSLDTVVDRVRYWIEDNNALIGGLKGVNGQIDLTADGFARGSVEAEAYRKVTLGTATAADYAALKTSGMSDATILALDASGNYREELSKVTPGQTQFGNAMQKSGQQTATATQKLRDYQAELFQLSEKNLAAAESEIDYRAAVKSAGEAVDKKKIVTDSESQALIIMARQANLVTKSLDAQGRTVKEATDSHEAHRKKLIATAIQMGYTKTEAHRLADMYLTIPKGVPTKITQPGMSTSQTKTRQYDKQLDELSRQINTKITVFGDKIASNKLGMLLTQQSALKRGVYISASAAAAAYRKNAGDGYGVPGYDAGGYTGPGSKNKPAGIVHADEFVIKKESRKKIESSNPGALDTMNRTGRMPMYAGGGRVLNAPFPVNAAITKIPSLAEALAVVGPPGGGRTSDWIVRTAKALVPGIRVISKDRPGARTRSGNRSYHSMGRAVDFSPSRRLAELWNQRYFGRTKELISPWQSLNIHNGRRHHYSAAIYRQHSGGNAHDHIAMRGGGVIKEPVFGYGASGRSYSFAEHGPETVIPGMVGGGGGITITISAPISINGDNLSPTQIAKQVNRQLGSLVDYYSRGA